MDTNQIISIVLQVLLQVLPKISEKAQETLGEEIVKAPFKLYEIIRQRFQKSREAKTTLDDLQTSPFDPKKQDVFRKQLNEILEQDQSFTSELTQFITDSNIVNIIGKNSIDVSGNQSSVTQHNIQNIASNIIQFPKITKDVAEVFNLVINIQGGPDASPMSKAMLDLASTKSSLPSISKNAQGIDVIERLKNLFIENSIEFEYDLDLISKVLQPVVEAERVKNNIPSSGKFLRRLVNEIGIKLHDGQIFQSNQFAKWGNSDRFPTLPKKDGYRAEDISRRLPMPELANAFNVSSEKLALVQTTIQWKIVNTNKTEPNEQPSFISIMKNSFAKKTDMVEPIEVHYDLKYGNFSILPDGEEHHVIFSKQDQRLEVELWEMLDDERSSSVQKSKGKRRKNKSLDDEVYEFSADVLAKFIRAILHDYLVYMRPQATIKRMLTVLSSQDK